MTTQGWIRLVGMVALGLAALVGGLTGTVPSPLVATFVVAMVVLFVLTRARPPVQQPPRRRRRTDGNEVQPPEDWPRL